MARSHSAGRGFGRSASARVSGCYVTNRLGIFRLLSWFSISIRPSRVTVTAEVKIRMANAMRVKRGGFFTAVDGGKKDLAGQARVESLQQGESPSVLSLVGFARGS